VVSPDAGTMQRLLVLLFAVAAVTACNGKPADVASAPTATVSGEPTPVATSTSVQPSTLAKDGAACSTGAECASGICEGPGCETGTCAPSDRRCKRDRRPFCGCDGVTFFAGSNCPADLYERAGECETP
jgi:hypothetical protein